MKRRILFLTVFVCVTFVLLSSAALAQGSTTTATLNVSATVVDNVRIKSVGAIAFPNYDPTEEVDVDGAGDVSLQATQDLNYRIYIGSDRTMSDGTNDLTYELYSDAGRTSVWGEDWSGGEQYQSAGKGQVTYNIYGRVAANQDVPAGSYTDQVTITVEW